MPAKSGTKSSPADRRKYDRFAVPPMYTPLAVRLLDEDRFTKPGFAYDVSIGGVQFELDYAIAPGTPIAIRLELPAGGLSERERVGPNRLPIYALANVVWIEDEDQPGPVRMAAVITRFARAGDEDRLRARLSSGTFVRKAA